MRFAATAPQLIATSGFSRRREREWIVWAAASLPLPLSPVIMTGASERAIRAITAQVSRMA